MNEQIKDLAILQAQWSITANKLKSSYENAKLLVLIMAGLGAIFETAAAQLPAGLYQQLIGVFGVMFLASIPIISIKYTSPAVLDLWIACRDVSERFKSLSFRFRAAVGEFRGQNVQKLTNSIDDILGETETKKRLGGLEPSTSVPSPEKEKLDPLTPEMYVNLRLKNQAKNFYDKRADSYGQRAKKYRYAEFVFVLAAAVIGSIATYFKNSNYLILANLGVWVAVITTIGATLSVHIAANRFDELVVNYRKSAASLRNLAAEWGQEQYSAPSPEWDVFVTKCEATVLGENSDWGGILMNN